jgi:hypothetical protein
LKKKCRKTLSLSIQLSRMEPPFISYDVRNMTHPVAWPPFRGIGLEIISKTQPPWILDGLHGYEPLKRDGGGYTASAHALLIPTCKRDRKAASKCKRSCRCTHTRLLSPAAEFLSHGLSDGAVDNIPTATVVVNGSLEDVLEVGVSQYRIMVSQLPGETSPEARKERVLVTGIADHRSNCSSRPARCRPTHEFIAMRGSHQLHLGGSLHKQPFTEYRIVHIWSKMNK